MNIGACIIIIVRPKKVYVLYGISLYTPIAPVELSFKIFCPFKNADVMSGINNLNIILEKVTDYLGAFNLNVNKSKTN